MEQGDGCAVKLVEVNNEVEREKGVREGERGREREGKRRRARTGEVKRTGREEGGRCERMTV